MTASTRKTGSRKTEPEAPVITAEALRFMRQSDAVNESDLEAWEAALTESFTLEAQSTYGRALVLRGLLEVDGFVVSDYVTRARTAFTDKGMPAPSGLTEGTFSRLRLLVLAIAHGISPEATAATDRNRWADIVSTAWGNGPGRVGALRSTLKRVDAKRAEIDAALRPVEVDAEIDETEPTADDGPEVAEIDAADDGSEVTPEVSASEVDAFLVAASALTVAALSDEDRAAVRAAAASVLERVDALEVDAA